jgi:hypothetical protein
MTLAVGFAIISTVLLVVLLRVPDAVISTNSVAARQELGLFREHTTVCQADERLPASTSALRMSLASIARVGPAVLVTVSYGGQIVARGHHTAGWVSGSLKLPLQPTVTTPIDAKLCLTRGPTPVPVELGGSAVPSALAATTDGKPLPGRMRVEYLRRGHRSWLSLATPIARRLGLGHVPGGTWTVFPLALLMGIAVTCGAWLLIREQRYE